MYKRFFPVILVVSLIITCCKTKDYSHPNFILIIADDIGYGSLGCYGGTITETPNIDSLAYKGLLFKDFHSNGPVSTPSRVSILTGRYPQRSGFEGDLRTIGDDRHLGLDPEETTFVELLKDSGYSTGIVGKWALGFNVEYNPIYQGFDYFRGFMSAHIDNDLHLDEAGMPDWWHNLEKLNEAGYVPDMINRYSLEFIDKNHDQPFFLYVAPQSPLQTVYADSLTANDSAEITRSYRKYLKELDNGVGQIIKKVRQLGISDKTMIFLCSDNGMPGYLSEYSVLKGGKGDLWEGGYRVPAIAYWPGIVDSGVTNRLVVGMDIFPTFINLAGYESNRDMNIDGCDFSKLLIYHRGDRCRMAFWKYRDQYVVRSSKWKLMANGNEKYLFNIRKDGQEEKNLYDQKEKLSTKFEKKFEKWKMDVYPGVKMKTK